MICQFLGENRHATFYWHSQDSSSTSQGVSSSWYDVLLKIVLTMFKCHSNSILNELEVSLKAALVIDPVMVSTSGDVLAGPSIIAGFRYAYLLLITWCKNIDLPSGFILECV